MNEETKELEVSPIVQELINDVTVRVDRFYKEIGNLVKKNDVVAYLALFAFYYGAGLVVVMEEEKITLKEILERSNNMLRQEIIDILGQLNDEEKVMH